MLSCYSRYEHHFYFSSPSRYTCALRPSCEDLQCLSSLGPPDSSWDWKWVPLISLCPWSCPHPVRPPVEWVVFSSNYICFFLVLLQLRVQIVHIAKLPAGGWAPGRPRTSGSVGSSLSPSDSRSWPWPGRNSSWWGSPGSSQCWSWSRGQDWPGGEKKSFLWIAGQYREIYSTLSDHFHLLMVLITEISGDVCC